MVLKKLLAQADSTKQAIELCALRESASNEFYRRYEFVPQSEDDWNVNYRREPAVG
jgi:hypothetical protein